MYMQYRFSIILPCLTKYKPSLLLLPELHSQRFNLIRHLCHLNLILLKSMLIHNINFRADLGSFIYDADGSILSCVNCLRRGIFFKVVWGYLFFREFWVGVFLKFLFVILDYFLRFRVFVFWGFLLR